MDAKALNKTKLDHVFGMIHAAFDNGVKEVHLGGLHCFLCGCELGPAYEHEPVTLGKNGSPKIALHLCDVCAKKGG